MTAARLREVVNQPDPPWRRVERKTATGEVRDFVEVGECALCERGVDRAFPAEYRRVGQAIVCAECAGDEGHLLESRKVTGAVVIGPGDEN